ncbi:unnamed protein product [Strongylus vulgaris]|uniref:Uncharacterized protein n=1 Tax=Strongylus vulgaris TaxID=40348 RepID=A0A3P7J7Y5_STRVU|nr:unnamed protein product [Strongylus vulgaris]
MGLLEVEKLVRAACIEANVEPVLEQVSERLQSVTKPSVLNPDELPVTMKTGVKQLPFAPLATAAAVGRLTFTTTMPQEFSTQRHAVHPSSETQLPKPIDRPMFGKPKRLVHRRKKDRGKFIRKAIQKEKGSLTKLK